MEGTVAGHEERRSQREGGFAGDVVKPSLAG